MWAILIYVTIFLLFFRFCIKPLQHKYKKPDDGKVDHSSTDSFGDDILNSPMYSFMSCNIYHRIDDD